MMATCPDCGSIIMEGDPYCTHCGAHLVWSYDDEPDDYRPPKYDYEEEPKTNEEKLDDILDSMYLSNLKKAILKDKIITYLNAKDCIGLDVDSMSDEPTFTFTRENEYVRTSDEFIYKPEYDNESRVFWDCYTTHNHDRLLENPRFKELLKGMGFEFIGCRGGYETEFINWPEEFRLIDKVDVRVRFKIRDNLYREYHLDLENMKLDEDYYEWSE